MTETTKTPNPLKQARREKREAEAILQFLRGYRSGRALSADARAEIKEMIALAKVRIEATSDALALLQAAEVTK